VASPILLGFSKNQEPGGDAVAAGSSAEVS
jgi:hypothetical protein